MYFEKMPFVASFTAQKYGDIGSLGYLSQTLPQIGTVFCAW
jgi:hypothetical protein